MTTVPPRRRLGPFLGSLLLGSVAAAGSAQGVENSSGQVYTLTEQQKAQLRAQGSEASAEAALTRAQEGGADRAIHGEIGAVIGTGGTRGLFGTAAIPIGENGGALISFENSRVGNRRYR